MVYVVNAILVAAVRQLCNSCATVVQQLCDTSIWTSVAQHLTCATPGLEQVLCMFNTSRALFNVELGTLTSSVALILRVVSLGRDAQNEEASIHFPSC